MLEVIKIQIMSINKYVSKLSFNPGSIDQVSFYLRRLHQEQSIRRLGLFFVILSFLVQIVATSLPARQSLAASPNDVISGGVSSISDLKSNYYHKQDVKELYNRFGLNAAGMDSVQNTSFNFQDQGSKGTRTVGRINFASTNDHNLGRIGGKTFYSRNAAEWQGSTPAYYFGKSKGTDNRYWYVWVLKDCGNIAYRPAEGPPPPQVTPPVVACTSLTANQRTGTKSLSVKFTGAYSANTNNIVNGLTFNFGDGQSVKHNGTVIDHTYTNNGTTPVTYTATLTINSTVGDKTSSACQTTITVTPEKCTVNPNLPECNPCPYNPALAKNDPKCKEACPNNPALPKDDPKCMCIDNPKLPADDSKCTTPGRQKKARNVTQNLNSEQTLASKARANDVIEYSLITTNTNIVNKKGYLVEDYIGDVLDYADIDMAYLESQGGKFNAVTKVISWDNETIPAKGELQKLFRVKMKSSIPVTRAPSASSTSYDCKIQNGYGNEISMGVECPVLKQVEQLPNTGPGQSVFFAFAITTVSGYFFARSRLFTKELGIIKQEFTYGGK